PNDLYIVRPDEAGVILIPSPGGENPDVHLIKTLLALRHHEWRNGQPPIVAIVVDSTNMPAATLAGGPGVTLLAAEDLTARLVVQSRRHPGLSVVCTDLLSFDGNEMYIRREPTLAGRTFGEALTAYATATLLGVRRSDGSVKLNPSLDTVID